MIFIWTTASMCYYLITYQLKYIQGNIYFNNIVSAISDIIAYLVSGVVFKRIGFRNTNLISFLMAIVGMQCLIFIKTEQ